jgi:phosphoenolpyruvate carboxykinase (ATP)
MKLSFTRAMISAALNGELDAIPTVADSIFGLHIPQSVPNVPTEILTPRNTWTDKSAYDKKANELAAAFVKNFSQYANFANEEILAAAPKVMANS